MYKYDEGKHEPHVYFIQFGTPDSPVKIGWTRNIGARLRSLREAQPHDLVLLIAVPGGLDLERKIHATLAKFKIRGEWFEARDEVRTFIDEVRCSELPQALKLSIELARDVPYEEIYAHTQCPRCGRQVRAQCKTGRCVK